MVKNTDLRSDEQLALKLAKEATADSLAQLATLSSRVRNSAETYTQLGLVTGEQTETVIDYIVRQTRVEKDQLPFALKALASLHTSSAEKSIRDIAKAIPIVGPQAISALQDIGTETAADKIIELAQENDDLVEPAIRCMDILYRGDENRFASHYKRLLGYSLQPTILDRLVKPILDNERKLTDLNLTFYAVADTGLLPTSETPEYEQYPQGLATKAFKLAVHHAQIKRELDNVEQSRKEMAALLSRAVS